MTRRLFILFACCFVFAGCVTPKENEKPASAKDFRYILQDFHMKLRWGLWEQAADYTSPEYRNEFLGRYEELGEDYKITNLNVKNVTLGAPVILVDVEQEWYVEPNMTVQKKRYVESWVAKDGTFKITERMTRDEYRKRKKEAAEAVSADSAESEDEPTAEEAESDDGLDAPTGEWQ